MAEPVQAVVSRAERGNPDPSIQAVVSRAERGNPDPSIQAVVSRAERGNPDPSLQAVVSRAERGNPDPSIQAVVFDWGGTLTPWHTVDVAEQWRVFAAVYAAEHPDHPDGGARLAARILEVETEAWQRTRADAASTRIEELLEAAGVLSDHPTHPAAQAAYEEFWEPHTHTDAEVGPLFRGLRERGIAVGVLSNTIWSRDYHRAVFERDGVLDLIDGDVYSSEIPWTKPHPEAFRAAMEAVGATDPARCVYVGDRVYEDVHGAQAAGMRAILVPHSDIPVDQQVPVDAHPDGVAHRLLDVLDLVERWNR